MSDGEMGPWGRIEFRWVLRKSHYTKSQRGAFLTLWCLAGLEGRAGRLKMITALEAVGQRDLGFLEDEGDVEQVDGSDDVLIHGWAKYQEPLERTKEKARERQRRHREKQNAADRDDSVTDRDDSVTQRDAGVTLSSLSHSLIDSPLQGDARASDVTEPVYGLARLVETLTGRPWAYSPGSKTLETLRYDVRDFGAAKVEQALRSVAGANGRVPDAAALVLGAHRLLVPIPDAKEARKVDAEAKEREAFDKRVEATRRRNAALQGDSV
jgi:hypothetical protein